MGTARNRIRVNMIRLEDFSPNAGSPINSPLGLNADKGPRRPAITNRERIGKALELLKTGLMPFIKREMHMKYGDKWVSEINNVRGDMSGQLDYMERHWGKVFSETLGDAELDCINELIDVRNRLSRQKSFSGTEADRALDSAAQLLKAVSAPEADEVAKMRMDLRRLIFGEQARSEHRTTADKAFERRAVAGLAPWREVVAPHKDVTSGLHWQSEFVADLWKVHLGQSTADYGSPIEFFDRTLLVAGLSKLLTGAIRRLQGEGGDPVVLIEANSGCGKTHALLALYHLFAGVGTWDLSGIDAILAKAKVSRLPQPVKRAVLVGNKICPGHGVTKNDGTLVRTLWGELAWQLGGRAAFERIRSHDENASDPGDELYMLINDHAPCLILVDEWLPYMRQLHDEVDLPAGDLETHLSFARTLVGAARRTERCLLAVSLPSMDVETSASECADEDSRGPHSRAVLARLRNAIGETNSGWMPASTEENCHIIRHRLFEPLAERERVIRDRVTSAFAEFYRSHQQDFPPECGDAKYEGRLKELYPIHPEAIDQLYAQWSTLTKFQRTRGVLRFMASVIGSEWENGDRSPLVMPANTSLNDPRVRNELMRCLPERWERTFGTEIDGPEASPRRTDNNVTELGKLAICQRTARAVFLGSAPTALDGSGGLDRHRIKLGCAVPGEMLALFDDALSRLSGAIIDPDDEVAHIEPIAQPPVQPVAQAAENRFAEGQTGSLKHKLDLVASRVEGLVSAEMARHDNEAAMLAVSKGNSDCVQNEESISPAHAMPKRYYGRVALGATRMARDAGLVSGEVIFQLSGLEGAKVKVTLEIAVEVPDGIPENVVQTVTENARKLKFAIQGFETE